MATRRQASGMDLTMLIRLNCRPRPSNSRFPKTMMDDSGQRFERIAYRYFQGIDAPAKRAKRPEGLDDKQVVVARNRETFCGRVITQGGLAHAACFHLSCNFSDGSARGVTR